MNGIVEETCFLPFNRFRDAGLTRLSSFREEEYPQGEVVGEYIEEGKPTTPFLVKRGFMTVHIDLVLHFYLIGYALKVVKHGAVLIAKNSDTGFSVQVCCPAFVIIFAQSVRVTVQFYRKFYLRAIEINDVGADSMLTPEFQATDLTAFQKFPKGSLSRGGMVTELPALE